MKLMIAAVLMAAMPLAAGATSGSGCLRVTNVSPGDTLNLRAEPSARSRIVARLVPEQHGIIHLDAQCAPLSRPWGQRWCQVSVTDGDGTRQGYVKARYVRDAECP